jgi:uncharacterized membrane protein
MPATTKKVTKPVAKRTAKVAPKGPTTKILEAALKAKAAKVASKPAKAGKAPVATVKPVVAPKAATASEKPATGVVQTATGAKMQIITMIASTKGGVSAAEIAKTLGWPRAGGTISRAIKLAPFKVAKARDAEGVLRYSRAGA